MSKVTVKAFDSITWPVRYDSLGQYIFDKENNLVAKVRGYGNFQNMLGDPDQRQDEVGELIAESMNDKAKKEGYFK